MQDSSAEELTQKSLAKAKLQEQREIERIKTEVDLESLEEPAKEREEEFNMDEFVDKKFVG